MHFRTPIALAVAFLALGQPGAAQSLGGALDQLKSLGDGGGGNVAVDIAENGRTGSYDCAGRNARISGNDNKLSLAHCATVVVSGNQNQLRVRQVRVVRTVGNDNAITWHNESGAKPTVDNPGSRNNFSKA